MRYAMAELAARAGVQPRTIRAYIQRGIVERPPHGGAKTTYDEATLLRACAAAVLLRKGKTFERTKRELNKMKEPELRAFVAREAPSSGIAKPPPQAPSAVTTTSAPAAAASPIAAALAAAGAKGARRLKLLPGLELVLDDDAPDVVKRLAIELTREFRAHPVT